MLLYVVNTNGYLTYYNNTSLANYCYNEQLVGGDLHPVIAMVSDIHFTIRTEGYSIRSIKFTYWKSEKILIIHSGKVNVLHYTVNSHVSLIISPQHTYTNKNTLC